MLQHKDATPTLAHARTNTMFSTHAAARGLSLLLVTVAVYVHGGASSSKCPSTIIHPTFSSKGMRGSARAFGLALEVDGSTGCASVSVHGIAWLALVPPRLTLNGKPQVRERARFFFCFCFFLVAVACMACIGA